MTNISQSIDECVDFIAPTSDYAEFMFRNILRNVSNDSHTFSSRFTQRWLRISLTYDRTDVAEHLLDLECVPKDNLTFKERICYYQLLGDD